MKPRALLAVAPLALLVACGGGEEPATVDPALQRINASEDCAALQADFDEAAATFDRNTPGSEIATRMVERMEAIDARMQEVGCY